MSTDAPLTRDPARRAHDSRSTTRPSPSLSPRFVRPRRPVEAGFGVDPRRSARAARRRRRHEPQADRVPDDRDRRGGAAAGGVGNRLRAPRADAGSRPAGRVAAARRRARRRARVHGRDRRADGDRRPYARGRRVAVEPPPACVRARDAAGGRGGSRRGLVPPPAQVPARLRDAVTRRGSLLRRLPPSAVQLGRGGRPQPPGACDAGAPWSCGLAEGARCRPRLLVCDARDRADRSVSG